MKRITSRFTPILGLLAPVPVLVGSTAAAARYSSRGGESYSLLRHTISDLGNPSHSAWAIAFNLGIMLSGFCIALFIVGTSRRINRKLGHAIAAVGIVTTIAMACIGVFPSQHLTRTEHLMSATVAFFGILLLSSSLCLYLPFSDQKILPRWLVVPSFISAGTAFIFILVIAARQLDLVDNSALSFHWGQGSNRVYLLPALEWLVFLCSLLLCCSTAFSLLRSWPAQAHNQPESGT